MCIRDRFVGVLDSQIPQPCGVVNACLAIICPRPNQIVGRISRRATPIPISKRLRRSPKSFNFSIIGDINCIQSSSEDSSLVIAISRLSSSSVTSSSEFVSSSGSSADSEDASAVMPDTAPPPF